MYFLIKKSLKVKTPDNTSAKAIELSPTGTDYKDIFFLTDDKVSTGMTPPFPESLCVIYNNSQNSFSRFLVSEKQLTDSFVRLVQIQRGDELTLLNDCKARDNCYNSPRLVNVPKGTKLIASQSYGTRRGEYFFDFNGVSVNLYDLYCPHPESLPLLKPDFFALKRESI